MNKVVNYLNEHLQGEVLDSPAIRAQYAVDGSILTMQPEMVAFVRTTSDIRKIARFAWQLAEKGHSMPLTVRGSGGGISGGAIGAGVIIDTAKYLHAALEFDAKQKLARVQPGITVSALNDGLRFHSVALPTASKEDARSTLGGAIAENARSEYSGKYGATGEYVDQLEVVLANGDVLQTGRLARREVAKKKNLQTFEGEIYRSVDALIAENADVINSIGDTYSLQGYPGIASVKKRDGSMDLTPLFLGSQGTLGIISEIILRGEYVSPHSTSMLAVFKSAEEARDAMDEALMAKTAAVEYFSGELLKTVLLAGKKFEWMSPELLKTGAVLLIEFDDYQEKIRTKNARKLARKLQSRSSDMLLIEENEDTLTDLAFIRSALSLVRHPSRERAVTVELFGAMVPLTQMDVFQKGLLALSKKHTISLPMHVRAMDSMFSVYPVVDFSKVSERQKVFTLLEDYINFVVKLGGTSYAHTPEGRIYAPFRRKELGDDVLVVYDKIKEIFDPYAILNPGVKQAGDEKALLKQINPRFSARP